MTNTSRRAITAMLIAFSLQAAHAAQFHVEDVSNKIITCDHALLQEFPPGWCLTNPDNTLALTGTLDAGEDISALNEMHLVAYYQGQFYKYDGTSAGYRTDRWKLISLDAVLDASAAPSIPRAPWEKDSIAHPVYLGDFATKKGADIYIGTRAHSGILFSPKNIKWIFTVK